MPHRARNISACHEHEEHHAPQVPGSDPAQFFIVTAFPAW